MDFSGAEIPAWGMFALAVIYSAFQFVLKWQVEQEKKAAKRSSSVPPEQEVLKQIADQLVVITRSLADVATVLTVLTQTLDKVADESRDLHESHLGPKATDENNRPKWWNDYEGTRRLNTLIEEMNQRMLRLEMRLVRRSSHESASDLPRPYAEKK